MPGILRIGAASMAAASLTVVALTVPVVADTSSAQASAAHARSAKHATAISVRNAASTTVRPGTTAVALFGQLTRAGKPAGHKRVTWYSRTRASQTWRVRGVVRTSVGGSVRIADRPTTTTSYKMRFAGSKHLKPSSSDIRVLVVSGRTNHTPPSMPPKPSKPTPPVTTPPVTTPPAPGGSAPGSSTKLGVYLAGNAATSSRYPDSQMSNVYLNNKRVPVAALEARIDGGESLNITAAAVGKPYITGLISGDSAAIAWADDFISGLKQLQDYATAANNGTYIVGSIYSEAGGRLNLGQMPDHPTASQVGQAQQIFIRRLEAAAPAVVSAAWEMGYDHTFESAQLAQITSPKPDIITIDPYQNHACTGSLSTITAGSGSYSISWYKSSPAYNGSVAISETGMATGAGCTDTQVAGFYTDVAGQVRTVEATSDVHIPFWVMFNSSGNYPHDITTGAYSGAASTLAASLANQ